MKGLSVIAMLLATAWLLEPAPSRADTTADCGRFHLKYDKKSGKMKCVGGKKRKRAGPRVTVQSIRRQQRSVQQIIGRAQNIRSEKELSADERRRARTLIAEARQRIQEIRRQTSQLRQEQESFTEEIANAARQRSRAQQELSRALEQQQRDLTRQLVAQQRQLQQALQRNRQAIQRRNR